MNLPNEHALSLVDQYEGGVLAVDPLGKVSYANQAVLQALSTEINLLLGKPLAVVMPDMVGTRLERAINRALNYNCASILSPMLLDMKLPWARKLPLTGNTRSDDVLVVVKPIQHQGINSGCVLFFNDLTRSAPSGLQISFQSAEQVGFIEQLTSALTQLTLLFDRAQNAIILFNSSAIITRVNRAGAELLKESPGEIVGQPIDNFLPELGIFISNMNRLFDTQSSESIGADQLHRSFETGINLADGEIISVEVVADCIPDNDPDKRLFSTFLTDVTDKHLAEKKLIELTTLDPTTELLNKQSFVSILERSVAKASQQRDPFYVLVIDIDDFKRINDHYGHDLGDEVLKTLATRMRNTVFSYDVLARLAADQFALLAYRMPSALDLVTLINQLLEAIAEPFDFASDQILVSASIGIAHYPDDGDTAEKLLTNADHAMYVAKNQPHDHYFFFSKDIDDRIRYRNRLQRDLATALSRQELSLHYLPVVDLADSEVVGVEALLRWAHPDLGFIPPEEFISISDESGLAHELTDFVLKTMAADYPLLKRNIEQFKFFSLNLSIRQLLDKQLLHRIDQHLSQSSIPSEQVVLEVTEQQLIDHPAASMERLKELRQAGLRVAIDDFGVSYSSLAFLNPYPIDFIKIDKSYTDSIDSDQDGAIVRSTIALAQELGIPVIAEGVESKRTCDAVARHQCYWVQGFYVAKPMTIDKLIKTLRSSNALLNR